MPQPPAQANEPVYTLHATRREVNLDVVVTDRSGKPVEGLKRDDFRVFDEGKPQALLGFMEHLGSGTPTEAEFKLPPNTFTNYAPVGNPNASFVILFDSLDSTIDVQQRAFVEATDFLKDLAPGTSVAIFDLNQRMNLVQGFTTDRTVLLNALKDKRAQPQYSALLGTGNEVWRQQILNEGMMMLGRYLSGFPGRKNLIWFTVNIPGSVNSRTASIHEGAPPGALAGAGVATDVAPTASTLTTQTVVGQALGVDQQGQATAGSPDAVQSAQTTFGSQGTGANGQPAPAGNRGNGQVSGVSSQDPFQTLTNLIDDSKSTSDVLTLSRVVVYPVDPRELMTPQEMAANPNYRFEQAAMQDVAEATGGEAFYNRNGIKSIMQEIVAKGSDYYTLTYSPTNTKWDGTFRKLKVETVGVGGRTDQSGFHLEYRPGYYAADRLVPKGELASGFTSSNNDQFVLESELKGDIGGIGLPPPLPKESLQVSMTIGQIPPTELILNASVKPSASALKLVKGATMPEGDYMRDKFKRQPYRMYDVLFATDLHRLQLPRSPDGLHHGGVEFVAVVYTDQGDVVNSFKVTISLNLKEDSYRALLKNGLGTKHSIAIPVKGNYVVRLGVHDLNSDRVGALEFPLTAVNLGVAGVGQQGTP
jgi:VWFA-related protein